VYSQEISVNSVQALVSVALDYSDTVKKIDAVSQQADIPVKNALADYDAVIKASVLFKRDDLDTNLPLPDSPVSEQMYSASISKPFSSGTALSLGISHSRSPVEMYGITPNRITSVSLSISQELLKNSFGLIQKANIDMSGISSAIKRLLANDALEEFIYDLENAYFSWEYLSQARKFYSQLLKQTEWLEGVYKQKLSLGTAESPDMLYVSAAVLSRRLSLMEIEHRLLVSEIVLESLSGVDLDLSEKESSLSLDDDINMSLGFYQDKALENRRDYAVLSMSIEQLALKMKIDENSFLPSLKLNASIIQNSADDSIGDTFNGLFRDGNEFSIGLNLSMPLERKKEYAAMEEDMLKMEELTSQATALEDKIKADVESQYLLISSLKKRLELAQKAVVLQEKRLEGENKRITQGRSNADLLLRAQVDLLNARLAVLNIDLAYKQAVAKLYKLCAMTLPKYNISEDK